MKATRVCTVENCERPAKSLGLCGMHHQRQWRLGATNLPDRPRVTCSVEGCPTVAKAQGYCPKHYERLRRHGDPLAHYPTNPTPYERVMSRTAPGPDGCIEYQGTRGRFGYGQTRIGSRIDGTRRSVKVHRLVWEEHHGPIPEGLVVRHKCDNPPCCNIEHLEIGTQQDNIRDKVERGRSRWSERTA